MTIRRQWIQRSVLCGLLLGGAVGCSMVASPPSQIAQSDHSALAAWYDKEAADLRQKAKNMEDMKVKYRNNPALADHTAMGGSHKAGLIQHCDNLIALYTKGAEEADQMAKEHRSMK